VTRSFQYMVAMFLIVALTMAVCGGSETPGSDESAISETLEFVASSPGIMPSSFEKMLGYIADTPESRDSLQITDIAELRVGFGIVVPGDEATFEQTTDYMLEVMVGAYKTVGIQLTNNIGTGGGVETFLSGFKRSNFRATETTRDSLGFDVRNVDQVATFGDYQFGGEILLGSFTPEITDEHLAAYEDCVPHDVVTHSNVGYYAWGEDLKQSLKLRIAKPAYDNLGRGGRIVVMDGMAARTFSHDPMKQIIDASKDVQPSLADDPDYVMAAMLLASYGAMNVRFTGNPSSVESSIARIEEAWGSGLEKVVSIEEMRAQFAQSNLVQRYKVAAVGSAFPESEGGAPDTYAVLIYSSETEAIENASQLKKRIEEDEYFREANQPNRRPDDPYISRMWLEKLTDYEVWSEGNAVILRVNAECFGNALEQPMLWDGGNPIIIHNLLVTE